jgi:ribosomal protein S12 methylthiotransferase
MQNNTFHIVSLGCDKNSVDSDSMAQLLINAGYEEASGPGRAKIIIVNTCGFINDARMESYNMLEKLAARKKKGQILIAAGCLTQRYGNDFAGKVPGIDAVLGTRRWMDIVSLIQQLGTARPGGSPYCLSDSPTSSDEPGIQRISVQGASAYIKIADGCSRTCAYCAIPLIKGPAVSRPVESILAEAVLLQSKGVREIILVAQNTTDYGLDLGLKNGLARLLEKMTAAAPDIDWMRIMYAYPDGVTDDLIEVMAARKQIVPYIDMPLQHADESVLRNMHRPSHMDKVYGILHKLRRAVSGIALRSTFIIGYPGETEKEFNTLLDFISEVRFDKLGAFKFSFETGTASETLGDPVPDEVKEERLKRLMEKQQHISLQLNQEFIGRNLDVLIEGSRQGISMGRCYRDAPQVDGLVLVDSEISAGTMVNVHINNAMVYDLGGGINHP